LIPGEEMNRKQDQEYTNERNTLKALLLYCMADADRMKVQMIWGIVGFLLKDIKVIVKKLF
jgi:hypothetical protein